MLPSPPTSSWWTRRPLDTESRLGSWRYDRRLQCWDSLVSDCRCGGYTGHNPPPLDLFWTSGRWSNCGVVVGGVGFDGSTV